MMNALLALALRTLKSPREVAGELMHMGIARSHLWSALALAVVLNTLAYQLSLVLSPPPAGVPTFMASPVIFALLVGTGLLLSAFGVTYTGRMLGGTGSLDTILTLLIWLQFLRFGVQLVGLVLMLALPGLAGMLILAASLYGMWLLLNFIDVGHGLDNLMKSVGVLVLSGLAIMLGLAVVLTLVGVQNLGVVTSV